MIAQATVHAFENLIQRVRADCMALRYRITGIREASLRASDTATRDDFGTLHVNACALRRELSRLIVELETRYGFKGET